MEKLSLETLPEYDQGSVAVIFDKLLRDAMAASGPNSEEQVIESRLLTALDDDDKVAIVASQRDLDLMIRAFSVACMESRSRSKFINFRDSLVQLREAAFS